MIIKKTNLNKLSNFGKDNSYLSIVERKKPRNSDLFFKDLLVQPISISVIISKNSAFSDIKKILDKTLSLNLKNNLFYNYWIKDMSNITGVFSDTIQEQKICFNLETLRGCKRYHIDNVPMRLLVTYYGKGTEWLHPDACNYLAYNNGEKNNKIIKKNAEKKYLNNWDIAIFKGKKYSSEGKGILHRTPDAALGKPSLLMRLDSHEYLT